ncbi:MAG: AAA family ATPase [bacterium]|nr:AAA family ATPase [bacterium]
MAKLIIGLAGEIGSGKGTAAKYVAEKYGASSYRFSTMLRDVMDRLYIEQNRKNISELSTLLRKRFGEDLLAKVMAEDVKKDENKVIVIEGIRRSADIAYLKEIPEFKFVFIEAKLERRYKRIIQRGENTDDKEKTFEEFKKEHELETEAQIKDFKQHADFVLKNDGALEDLYKQIDDIISKN